MTEKKSADEYFKDFLESADPVVKEQFPEYKTVLKVAKTLSNVKFRTRYNCFVDDAEHPDPVSVVERGRAESLDNLVRRLTGKQNPSMRDLSYLAIKQQGSDEFEDPTSMSDEEISERMERVVAKGDKLDAEEALISTITADGAVEQGYATSERARTKDKQASEEVARSETDIAPQNGAEKSA